MSVKNPNSFINCFSPNSSRFFLSSKIPGRGGTKKPRQFLVLSKTNRSFGRLCLDGVCYFNSGSCRHPSIWSEVGRFVRAHPPSISPPLDLSCPNHLRGSRAQPQQWPMKPNHAPCEPSSLTEVTGPSPIALWELWLRRNQSSEESTVGDTHVLPLSPKPRTKAITGGELQDKTQRFDWEKLLPRGV